MQRTVFVYKDATITKASTGDINLLQTNPGGEIEIEFELVVDGSCTDAGESWSFSDAAGASSDDSVTGYGIEITRAPSNATGESVSDQFSVEQNGNGNLTITDANPEPSSTGNGAGQFQFTITLAGTLDGGPIWVQTDPMIYNRG